jgi:hypothetical protein
MRTMTYNVEAAPWSKNNHFMGTRLFPSRNNSNNSFSGTLLGTLRLR